MTGNERPCESCVKRGMALKCVDGFRKPPKYLCDSPPKTKKSCSHRTKSLRRDAQHEFIDPTLLHTGSSSPESDSSAETELSWQERNNALCFSRKLQHYPRESARAKQSEQPAREGPCQATDDVPRDSFSEALAIGTLMPPTSNLDGCDGHSITEVHGSGTSYGFTISSGWSSTFFPCGMEEEMEEPKAMTMAVRGTGCANLLAWGQGMREGSRANLLF